jgi:hypothetical protein
VTNVTRDEVTSGTAAGDTEAKDTSDDVKALGAGGPERGEGVDQMAEKKISPKAATAKSSKDDSAKDRATRVTKMRRLRKARRLKKG